MANELLNFKHGLWSNLKNSSTLSPGTIYVTRDERAMYIDLPEYQNSDGTVESPKRIRIGDMRIFEKLSDLTGTFKNDMSELTKSALYYVEKNDDGTLLNGLYKWNGNTFIRLNEVSDVSQDLSDLTTRIGAAEATIATHTTDIATNATNINNVQIKANDAYSLAQAADGKADTNAENITNINNVIGNDDTADTIKGRIKIAEDSISDINDAIGNDDTDGTIKGRIKDVEDSAAANKTAITTIQTDYATKDYADQSEADAITSANGYTDTEIGKTKTELIGTEVTGNTSTIKGIKKYADEQIASINTTINTLKNSIGNLSNIMNFRGTFEATSDVTDPINGDVIIVNGIEFVYVKPTDDATGTWEEFGAATANESRFSAIEEAAEQLEARVTALDKETDGRVAIIESNLDALEDTVASNTTAINTEKGRVDNLINTTIPGIEAKIGDVEEGKNLAQMIADETSRATGIENGLNDRLNTLENNTIPGINTAHNTLANRVTALDEATTGRMAVAETDITILETKTGIANLTGDDTLYSLIVAEAARADAEEKDIRADFAQADAAIRTELNAALTWGTF